MLRRSFPIAVLLFALGLGMPAGGAPTALALGPSLAEAAAQIPPILLVNIGTVTVDGGAQWTLTGDNTLGSGVTLNVYGTLTNSGTLDASAGTLFVDQETLDNTGYIVGPVTLGSGGYLQNETGGTITGSTVAVFGAGGPGTVVNDGTILGPSNYGVLLLAGGSFDNTGAGLIEGPNGVFILGSGLLNALPRRAAEPG
jgi:fibronectin-binding autotransporter adhesin